MKFILLSSAVFWAVIISIALLFSGCATVAKDPEPAQPEPIEPEVTPAVPMADTPESIFDREVDACFVAYRACQKLKEPKSACFPPQEKCVIAAYRKLKVARGQ